MELNQHLKTATLAAEKASDRILEIYNSDEFDVELKGDNSPLTRADKASHEIISQILASTNLPILSEEGKDIPFEERSQWDYFWMVDPIDGTKEFIKRNGEFTVNIALIHQNQPILGVVMVPVNRDIFHAIEGQGAYKNGEPIRVNEFDSNADGVRVVASRSHMSDDTKAFIESFKEPKIVSKGSSLKLLMVAEGEADIYPRFAPTMEWDTAAAQIIVEEAGGEVLIKESGNSVSYNKENLLNPYFKVSAIDIG